MTIMGKTTSKLDKTRSQSMAWSYKFGTIRRKNLKNITMPHLDVKEWLKRLDLVEYEENFKRFEGVEEMLCLSENTVKKLGIRNNAHRARIMSSLVALREANSEKENPGTMKRNRSLRMTFRNSVAVAPTPPNPTDGPIYELLTVNSTKQSKSCGDLLDMDTPDTSHETVALKKALEWELSLDSRDLRSHAWYHGPIPRQRAEEIVQKEGDFLIRDCVSQPGNYVLTCKTKGPTLHFVINKLIFQPETVYERVQYQFEDDAYDTVPDLITFYVGSGKPISAASGARIQFPCNRIYPLSFYANKYGQNTGIRGPSPLNSPSPVPQSPGFRYNYYTQQQNTTYRSSPMSSPPRTKRDVPPRLPSKKQRSQSLTPLQAQNSQQRYCSADGVIDNKNHSRLVGSTEKCNSADGVIHETMIRSTEEKCSSADGVVKNNTMSRSETLTGVKLPRTQSLRSSQGMLGSRTLSLTKDSRDQSLSPCSEQKLFTEDEENDSPPSPPPKPNRALSRNESMKETDGHGPTHHRIGSYHPSGSDSGNGSGDSAQSSATGEEVMQHRGVIIKNPKFIPTSMSSVTLRSYVDIDPVAAEQALLQMNIPIIEQVSKFDLENFNTLLLPFCDYKPLDSSTLNTFRMMLCENGPRIIANHLTRVDIKLILDEDEDKVKENPFDCTGIELVTLEHGKQFRKDLIERTQCIKLLVAVTILTCQDDLERAEMLNKWILIAIDTKTALGNLFGFSAIMLGICMPQILKLESTWHTLRQKYTDSAFTFEAKLRPTLNSMNDCSNPQAPNTTIPHLLPYILLKDRNINDILDGHPHIQQPTSLVSSCITPWETNTQDFGFSILFSHLDSVRGFLNCLSLYRKNAQSVINEFSRYDSLLEEAFRTEFHVKFLWGSKGAMAPAEERHSKFEHVLAVMSEKFGLDGGAG